MSEFYVSDINMCALWSSIIAQSDKILCVDLEAPSSGQLVIKSDRTVPVPRGPLQQSYQTIFQQFKDHFFDNGIENVLIKASALSRSGINEGFLKSAEVRGVIIAASDCVTHVYIEKKSNLIRKFGKHKAENIFKDETFWKSKITGNLRKLSREAVKMLYLFLKNKPSSL